jgi:hypothetical protein
VPEISEGGILQNARDEILGRLKAAPKTQIPVRPFVPPADEIALDREGLVNRFIEMFRAETGVVYRAKDGDREAGRAEKCDGLHRRGGSRP